MSAIVKLPAKPDRAEKRMPAFIFCRKRWIEREAPWLMLAGLLVTDIPRPGDGAETAEIAAEVTGLLVKCLAQNPDMSVLMGWREGRRPPDGVEMSIVDDDAFMADWCARHVTMEIRVDKSGDRDTIKIDIGLMRQFDLLD